jgi:ubiquinone/menaquinone biosynthesis C-methylase UbiE
VLFQKTSMQPKKPVKKTSWGNVSEWYDKHLETNEDTYQAKVIAPNLLRLLGIVKGKKLLDIACGQGYFSRLLRDAGAEVSGIDISSELIMYAKRREGEGIEYVVGSADNLSHWKKGVFDAAFCVLAIQNIENVPGVLSEASRVLKSDGRFLLVLNHPTFRVPQHSDWGYDEKKKVQYRSVDRYLSEEMVKIVMNPGKQGSVTTITFHRSLQFYFKAFHKAGFAVTRLEEWISHKASERGPRQAAEDRARKEIPLFMAIELIKI